MHDLSFLIRGMRIMEIGHFSFYMSFFSRLYHLISQQGDFNSRTWPKCYGGGGGGGVPQLPLKSGGLGLCPWVCALGLCICRSLPHHVLLIIIHIILNNKINKHVKFKSLFVLNMDH